MRVGLPGSGGDGGSQDTVPWEAGGHPDGLPLDLGHDDGGGGGPTHDWSRAFGGTLKDRGCSVAVDGSGNLYVAGELLGPVDFGGGEITNAGSYDIFIASFSADGQHRWSKSFGGPGGDYVGGLAVDGNGNLYLVGHFPGTIDFGGGALTSTAHSSIYLASFTSDGQHRWSKRFGGNRYARGYGVAVDGAGNVTISGAFQNIVNFGGGNLSSAAPYKYDAYLASFTPDGQHRWSQRFGDAAGNSLGERVALDGGGNVTLAGRFQSTVDFGGGSLTSAGEYDLFLASYSSDGQHRWSTGLGGPSNDYVRDVAVDDGGGVFITGYFGDKIDLGGGSLSSAGSDDIYLAGFDPDGKHVWSRRFGGATGDYGSDLAVDGSGNVLVTGHFGAAVDFGGGSLTSAGAYDAYLASFTPDGQHRWSRRMGGLSWDYGRGVVVDPGGAIVLMGHFESSADFGGGSLSSAGLQDIFVVRLSP